MEVNMIYYSLSARKFPGPSKMTSSGFMAIGRCRLVKDWNGPVEPLKPGA